MEVSEVMYRALLAKLYADYLIGDVDEVVVVYDATPSCVALASAVVALV